MAAAGASPLNSMHFLGVNSTFFREAWRRPADNLIALWPLDCAVWPKVGFSGQGTEYKAKRGRPSQPGPAPIQIASPLNRLLY
jgi:hypothetical protein